MGGDVLSPDRHLSHAPASVLDRNLRVRSSPVGYSNHHEPNGFRAEPTVGVHPVPPLGSHLPANTRSHCPAGISRADVCYTRRVVRMPYNVCGHIFPLLPGLLRILSDPHDMESAQRSP